LTNQGVYMPWYQRKVSGIYKITIGGKFYVGLSVNIGSRWAIHLGQLHNHIHPNKILQAAFDNAGKVASFEVLELVKKKELRKREKHWIKELDTLAPNGFNQV